jgi:DNA-binding transcriptional ArsR family regulator
LADSDEHRKRRKSDQSKDSQGKADGGRGRRRTLINGLNHDLRRQLLRRLNGSSEEPLSPVALSRELDKPLSHVSYHINVLKECGAVALVGEHQVRGAMRHLFVSKVADNAAVQAFLEETRAEDERR